MIIFPRILRGYFKRLLDIMGATWESKLSYVEAGLRVIDASPERMRNALMETFITMHRAVKKSDMVIHASTLAETRWNVWKSTIGFFNKVEKFCENTWERNPMELDMAKEVMTKLATMKGDERTMFMAQVLFGKHNLAGYAHVPYKFDNEELVKTGDDMDDLLRRIHSVVSSNLNWMDTVSVILSMLEKEPNMMKKTIILRQAFHCVEHCTGGMPDGIHVIRMGMPMPSDLTELLKRL